MSEIEIRRRGKDPLWVQVDPEDEALVSAYRWRAAEDRRTTYAITEVQVEGRRTTLSMHRLILGLSLGDGLEVDHVDHDGLNNRRQNLRLATDQQQNRNRRPSLGGSSAYKGVSWSKQHQRWEAHIRIDGKKRRLGLHSDETSAARAYDVAAVAAWGHEALTNFASEETT